MAHDQEHALNSSADHLAGTNGTLLGTESAAVAEKPFSTAATGSVIVQRQASGNITLPSTDPVAGTDATSKSYVDALVAGHRAPVQVLRMRNDSLSAPPGDEVAGDAFVVGAAPSGAWSGFAQGDIIEYDGASWNLVLANSGNEPPDNTRVVVKATGLGGSFTGQANNIAQYDATGNTWSFTAPNDGDQVAIIGENSIYENTEYIYDTSASSWVLLGTTPAHNNLTGLQGGTAGQYYHFTSTEHGELQRYQPDYTDGSNATPNGTTLAGAGWSVGDRGVVLTSTNSKYWWVYLAAGNVAKSVRMN